MYTSVYLYVATWERSTAYVYGRHNSCVDILHVVAEEIHDIAYIIQVNAVIIYVIVIDVRKHLCNVWMQVYITRSHI